MAGQALQEHAVRVPVGAADTTCRAGTAVVQGPAPPGGFLRALWVNRKSFASLQEGFEAGACQRADCAGAVVSQAEVSGGGCFAAGWQGGAEPTSLLCTPGLVTGVVPAQSWGDIPVCCPHTSALCCIH